LQFVYRLTKGGAAQVPRLWELFPAPLGQPAGVKNAASAELLRQGPTSHYVPFGFTPRSKFE